MNRLFMLLFLLLLSLPACAAAGRREARVLREKEGPPASGWEAQGPDTVTVPPEEGQAPEGESIQPSGGYPLISCSFYEEGSFLQSVDDILPYPAQGNLRAGVVPHHLLAGRMIASFFARAAQNDPPYESVILVGTSHYPTGNRLTTAYGGWQTPFGTLENDRAFTRRLTGNGKIAAGADEAAMERDHAISGLIPYVKYYLPEVSVSMVLIQNTAEAARVQALAEEIAGSLGSRRALLVCSTDFSHYLLPEEAALRDEETRRALEGYDYTAVSRFTDSNVDSPPALTVFMKAAERYGPVHFFDHSSSDRILTVPLSDPLFSEGTTSYFVLGALAGE